MFMLRAISRSGVVGLLMVLSSVARVVAQEAKTIEIDHSAASTSESRHVELKVGQRLNIVFSKTAEKCFNYDLELVEREDVPAGDDPVGKRRVEISLVHEDRYGGYIVRVTKSAEVRQCETDPGAKDLNPLTVVVVAETESIVVAFGGGFSVSGLTNPVFASKNQVVIEDKDAEDDVSLAVAALINTYGTGWSPLIPSITFGLGVGEEARTTYYFGPFWRLGSQVFLGGGLAIGSVNRLPAGVSVGDELSDPNTLTNLGSRIKASWFVGVSYAFLGGGKEAFEKPFKEGGPDTQDK